MQTKEDKAKIENNGAEKGIPERGLESRNQEGRDDKSATSKDVEKPCLDDLTQRKVQHQSTHYQRCGQEDNDVVGNIL